MYRKVRKRTGQQKPTAKEICPDEAGPDNSSNGYDLVHALPVVILTVANSTYKMVSLLRLLKTPAGKAVNLLSYRALRKDHEHKHLSASSHPQPEDDYWPEHCTYFFFFKLNRVKQQGERACGPKE